MSHDYSPETMRAKSLKRWAGTTPESRFWSNVQKTDGCWLWTAARYGNRYGAARDASGRQTCAHRVAWELSKGPVPDGMQVLHKCDNRPCVRPDHLFLGTQLDNMRDMKAKGRQARGDRLRHRPQVGEQNHGSKITEAAVRRVRELAAQGVAQAEISRRTIVTRANVWAIVHNKSWRHVR